MRIIFRQPERLLEIDHVCRASSVPADALSDVRLADQREQLDSSEQLALLIDETRDPSGSLVCEAGSTPH